MARRKRPVTPETARGFPAFPPGRQLSRRDRSWWSQAWVEAMEDTALDAGRLGRGRTYAWQGRVGSITVSPGRIAAPVHGSRGAPYEVEVAIERLSDSGWERFLEAVAARSGHIAALLDGEMPRDLVDAAQDAGVPLLPGQGDLEPACSCPDWGYPCKHAAALCYQASWLLDEDPFVLLLMRGRGRDELMDELIRRNAAAARTRPASGSGPAPGPVPVPAGTPVAEAFAVEQPVPEDQRPPPGVPVLVMPWTGVPAPDGLDPKRLTALALAAAARARAMLAEEADEGSGSFAERVREHRPR